jgi:uncharacterized protein
MGRAYLAMVAATAVAVTAGPSPAAASDDAPREIVVTGEGRVEAAPDMATVSAGVENQADTAEAALAANAEAMRRVLEALADAGIERRDVQTNRLSLDPVYRPRDGEDWSPEVMAYLARNMVTVRVRAVGNLGAVIDTMSETGANRIAGIHFGIAEPRSQEDAARAEAVADARARAELYADAAGVELGRVLAIRETLPFDQPFPMRAQMEAAMDGAIAEGAVEVTAMVEIVYEIED